MFTMRFDLRAPGKTRDAIADLYRTAVEMAAWADDKGCASIVISEHHASDDGYLPAPLPLAASMAAVTSRTPIMIGAALLPLYDPVRLAEEMIVLDHLSRGRVAYTFAIGYRPVEYELHGADFRRRGRILEEKLEVLLGALRAADAGDTSPRITPPPFTPGGPFVALGGSSVAAARRAGRFGLGFISQTGDPTLGEALRLAYEEAARANGHEPGLCIIPSPEPPTTVFVNDDLETGWREVGPALLADALSYASWNEEAGLADITISISKAKTIEEMRAENGPRRVVTVAEAVALIRAYGHLQLMPLCGGLDPETAWRYLRRVVEEVLPAAAASPAPEASVAN